MKQENKTTKKSTKADPAEPVVEVIGNQTAVAEPIEEQTAEAAETQPKKQTAEKQKSSRRTVLEKAGRAAITKHGFREVFVASDGIAFVQENDARHHAASLQDKTIIKVTKS